MKKVLLYSGLLVVGLIGSQYLPALDAISGPGMGDTVREVIRVLTMMLLGFIMIHVGYEFEIDRSNLRSYAVDYGVAATAAAFPWILCTLYFVLVMMPPSAWGDFGSWTEALLAGRFAAPTSAGVLFSMLAAAGLAATWLYRKARVLAIFDDLDTVLLMIPLKMLIVGIRWQLGVIIVLMAVMLWLAWKYLHRVRAPVTWPWVLGYAAVITLVSEVIYQGSKQFSDVVPIHIEVLLPAFVLGCMLARPRGQAVHGATGAGDTHGAHAGHHDVLETPAEQRTATIVSAAFMVLVGLSMPPLALGAGGPGWATLAMHTVIVSVLANLGKMFPLLCYRREAHWRERLALCIGMWPRGEVGAGVLVVSLSYGIGGAMVAVATMSLALNLLLTGVFIVIVKRLLASVPAPARAPGVLVPASARP